MFEKTLSDMVKGIRAHPRDEGRYISTCLAEIKEEFKTSLPGVKQQAHEKNQALRLPPRQHAFKTLAALRGRRS